MVLLTERHLNTRTQQLCTSFTEVLQAVFTFTGKSSVFFFCSSLPVGLHLSWQILCFVFVDKDGEAITAAIRTADKE